MYREQKVLIDKVNTRKSMLGVFHIPYRTQSSFSDCINECDLGSVGHRRLSYITEEALEVVAKVGRLGKLNLLALEKMGTFCLFPLEVQNRVGLQFTQQCFFFFQPLETVVSCPCLQTSGPGLSPEVTKLEGWKSVTVEMLGSVSVISLCLTQYSLSWLASSSIFPSVDLSVESLCT